MTMQFEGLDPRVWWRLAGEAEKQGTTVRALLAPPKPAPPTSLERLTSELAAARRGGFRVPRRGLAAEDRAWRASEKRRQNLESFRMMTEVW